MSVDPRQLAGQAADASIVASTRFVGEVFDLDGRKFVVKKLKFAPFLSLITLIIREMRILAQAGLLTGSTIDTIINFGKKRVVVDDDGTELEVEPGEDDEKQELSVAFEVFGTVSEHAPELFEQIFAIMLGATSAEDRKYIYEHIDFDQVPELLLAFMRHNPWRDVVAKLFTTFQEIAEEYQKTVQQNRTIVDVSSST